MAYRNCSHIINIFEKEPNPPVDKGNLFLSGVYILTNTEEMKKNHIKCVLTIIDKWAFGSFSVEKKVENLGIQHHKWIELDDLEEEKIFPHLDEAHSYIKSHLLNGNVLVHCQMGISRSSSLVIAFLMKEFGMDYHKARIFTKGKRSIIMPNDGFQKELLKFEEWLKDHHNKKYQLQE